MWYHRTHLSQHILFCWPFFTAALHFGKISSAPAAGVSSADSMTPLHSIVGVGVGSPVSDGAARGRREAVAWFETASDSLTTMLALFP